MKIGSEAPWWRRRDRRLALLGTLLAMTIALNLLPREPGPSQPAVVGPTAQQQFQKANNSESSGVSIRAPIQWPARLPLPDAESNPFAREVNAAPAVAAATSPASMPQGVTTIFMPPPPPPPNALQTPMLVYLGQFEDERGSSAFIVFNGVTMQVRVGDHVPSPPGESASWTVTTIAPDQLTVTSTQQGVRAFRAGEGI